jgi:CheY-like chemotaxis protein
MRILIVEDNRDAAEILALWLTLRGNDDVGIAGDAQRGLAMARAASYDLVLCDLMMPGDLDGFGFAVECRRDPALASMKLVAISGYAAPIDRARAIASGFNELLAKPVGLQTLDACIARVMGDTPPAGA